MIATPAYPVSLPVTPLPTSSSLQPGSGKRGYCGPRLGTTHGPAFARSPLPGGMPPSWLPALSQLLVFSSAWQVHGYCLHGIWSLSRRKGKYPDGQGPSEGCGFLPEPGSVGGFQKDPRSTSLEARSSS